MPTPTPATNKLQISSYSISGSITVSFWVYITTQPKINTIATIFCFGSENFQILLKNIGGQNFIYTGFNGSYTPGTTSPLSVSQWYYITVIIDRGTLTLELYVMII
jgi:hypothetical protein